MISPHHKEIALFDLDGTLVELRIDADEFEAHRTFWASHLTSRGIPTMLRPLLPELHRISEVLRDSRVKAEILRSFDALELACQYRCLGNLDIVLQAFRAQFHKLVLVTHNSTTFWQRLAHEHTWPQHFDVAITRDDMIFFKPDPRACAWVFQELTPRSGAGECWVIGNSEADRGLANNLRQAFPHLVFRTIMVDPLQPAATMWSDHLQVSITGVDMLPALVQDASVYGPQLS
jgi:phosphoglycolate phosphatase-like HAD superfamily hydrolase